MERDKPSITEREVGEMSANMKMLCREMAEMKSMLVNLSEKREEDARERANLKELAGRNATTLNVLFVFLPILAGLVLYSVKEIVGA